MWLLHVHMGMLDQSWAAWAARQESACLTGKNPGSLLAGGGMPCADVGASILLLLVRLAVAVMPHSDAGVDCKQGVIMCERHTLWQL